MTSYRRLLTALGLADPGTFDWTVHAACRGLEPADADAIFYTRHSRQAAMLCRSCPVVDACAGTALAAESGLPRRDRHGIFGGLTADERWQLDRMAASENTTATG